MFDIGDAPCGKTWEDWAIEWWQWLYAIENRANPVNDLTGAFAGINQHDPQVFKLAGCHAHKAERTISIPSGRALFFPVAGMCASDREFPGISEKELDKYATDGNQVREMSLIVDKNAFTTADLKKYRVKTGTFDVVLPTDSIWFWTEPGRSKAVAHGYYVFLKKLIDGEHEIRFSSFTDDDPKSGTINCHFDLTCHVIVGGPS